MTKTKRKLAVLFSLLLIIAIGVGATYFFQKTRSGTSKASPLVSIQVSGNQLVDGYGKAVRLIGVDLGGTQIDCDESNPSFYGATINQSFMLALESWHVNAIRITLNEDCWLGINGVSPSYSGAAYQSFVENAVSTMNAAGIEVIMSLARALPGTQEAGAEGTGPLPDADHSLTFWKSVASTFAGNPGVIFGAYGEPEAITWSCWLNGCSVASPAGGNYQGVGMQQLIDTIRSTGAKQPIMLGGVHFSSDLSGWLANKPTDPDNQLIASFHNYDDGTCNTYSCWSSTIQPLAASVPVITDEIGEHDCTDSYIDKYMQFADNNHISYLAWSWQVLPSGSCDPDLLNSYNGSPSVYGSGYQQHLSQLYQAGDIASLGSAPTPTPSPSSGPTPAPSSSSTKTTQGSPSAGSSSKTSSTSAGSSSKSTSSTSKLQSGPNLIISPPKSAATIQSEHARRVGLTITGAGLLFILLALAALYWLVIVQQGNKLKITISSSPPFIHIKIHPKTTDNSANPPTPPVLPPNQTGP